MDKLPSLAEHPLYKQANKDLDAWLLSRKLHQGMGLSSYAHRQALNHTPVGYLVKHKHYKDGNSIHPHLYLASLIPRGNQPIKKEKGDRK
ncbi:hypothetical protein AIN02nite_27150 [Acetobacter indonesiensis]|uniref:Uncharacterized protein n=1 Tax=Acetobacter indonesiensis TaxID=104101 RepID=A0A6N3T905_9PROT|nr:hypothetical protein AIN02nite_27150 [Acetobacter indonesiensis]